MTATIDTTTPVERSVSLPWEAIVRFAALATLCMSSYVLLHVAQSSSNPLDFIQPGAAGPSADVIRADFPDDELPAGLGLDGQQYYAVARDPTHIRDNADYLDRPVYRLQRPVFPLLAWALHPMGGGTGLIIAFIVIGIAALFVGCLATGALSTALGGPPWAAALFAATPGAFWSLRVTVADALALALALSAVAFAARLHHRRALLCAVVAVLTKEVALLVIIGWYLSNRSRRTALMVGASTTAMIGWAAVLRIVLPPDAAGVNEFGAPFVGLVRAAFAPLARPPRALGVRVDRDRTGARRLRPRSPSTAPSAFGHHRVARCVRGDHEQRRHRPQLRCNPLDDGTARCRRGGRAHAACDPDDATVTTVAGVRRDLAAPSSPAPDSSPGSQRPRAPLHLVVLFILAAQFVAIGLIEASRDSATVDEAVDVASGITIVARHDFRMNPEHGPLPKVLSALPALLAHPVIPNDDTYRDGAWFDYTDRFIAENTAAGRLDNVLLLARTVGILEGLAAAFLLYLLGRRLAGPWGGTVAASLWLTTPVFIGFSHFAMIDIAFTVALLAISYSLLRFFDDPKVTTGVWCGVACGAALLTRHNALPIVAVVAVACAVEGFRRDRRAALRNAAVVGAVAFALVWVFSSQPRPHAPER